MGGFSKVFFRGFITLLPVAITIYIVYSAIIILENLLGGFLRAVLPSYIPGLGLIAILVLIYVFGLMLNSFIASRFLGILENTLTQVPFIKAIYSPLRDLMNLFSNKEKHALQKVVLVNLQGVKLIGLVTREKPSTLTKTTHLDNRIAVYMPFSYALGGYTVLVDRNQVQEIDIPIEKAMSLAVTGWVSTEKKQEQGNHELSQ